MTDIKYTTLEHLKTFLGIEGSAEDTTLTELISIGTSLLDLELGGNLGQSTTERFVNGNGSPRLIFENTITAATGIKFKKGSEWYDATLDRIADSIVYTEEILPRGVQNVRITVSKGFATVPEDLEHFFKFYCKILYDNFKAKTVTEQGSKQIKRKSLESLSIEYFSPTELATSEIGRKNQSFLINYDNILKKYKNFSIKIG